MKTIEELDKQYRNGGLKALSEEDLNDLTLHLQAFLQTATPSQLADYKRKILPAIFGKEELTEEEEFELTKVNENCVC